MREQIASALAGIEREHGCRVLFACESGSRAWGFPSPDSDYDLRFLYAMPVDWHLVLEPGRDTLEAMLPGDLDLSGWELRKALRLFAQGNATLYEWLGSPVVYADRDGFRDELAAFIPRYFNPRKAMHHYLSLARGIAAEHLRDGRIGIKKFFYVLRPLRAADWIASRATMPPTDFWRLVEEAGLPAGQCVEIGGIRACKVAAKEGEMISLSPSLVAWVGAEQERLKAAADGLPPAPGDSWAPLDELLRRRTPR